MVKGKSANTKSFQIKMDEQVHELLKRRARGLKMTIGELIQNLLSSFEYRIAAYKAPHEPDINLRSDELDAKLLKLLILKDAGRLTEEDVQIKLQGIIEDYQQAGSYRPDLTISEDE